MISPPFKQRNSYKFDDDLQKFIATEENPNSKSATQKRKEEDGILDR